ncbi:MAG: UDP-N-acetyl-D-glucosamine 6-dehydrogenase [Pseudomonadota bacterium]|jgi:UDP-N-acetyl-D-galactosamine dehydrogenase
MLAQPRKISVTGLGYVGLTIATAFGQTQRVIGYDTSAARVAELKAGHDKNGVVSDELLKHADINYTANSEALKNADFHIVAVLTPVTKDKQPDFSILLEASQKVGEQLKRGDIVVFESTVYPGATEEKCIPTLEKASKLICGKDFSVGYSPERINPADKEHVFSNIVKVVSATDDVALDIIADVYSSVVKAGVHRVSTIRIAEATKVVENTQRDLNLSLINEIALILHSIGMDSSEVIAAARTKWNFLPFHPGLVGGHCIGINSYYLAHKAEEAGYYPYVIHAGRQVNESMARFLAETAIKELIHLGVLVKGARIGVLGLTYKENYADIHDTRIVDLINILKTYGVKVFVHDPLASADVAKQEYGINLQAWEDMTDFDAIILAVSHQKYSDLKPTQIQNMLRPQGLIMDVKGVLNPKDFIGLDLTLWRL